MSTPNQPWMRPGLRIRLFWHVLRLLPNWPAYYLLKAVVSVRKFRNRVVGFVRKPGKK